MKIQISGDKISFSAAHILSNHDKCSRLHGHNYRLRVEAEGQLNVKKMVVDFGEFKTKVRNIVKQFDHRILVPSQNKEFNIISDEREVKILTTENKYYRFPKDDVLILPIEATTAELLAKYIHNLIKETYPKLKITVSISETPTSIASFSE
ncbi:MAG: 6-pyruvoyl trahydropterin synthase family protein [Candidatus Heimdallarchaeaceae archaeon]|uniref:6-carboxytetrahydropterin synthase n=1 Tax=Candidatus Heimdallarchaeum endolithica TaxID=2876572 RepID=A0A9Y1BNZ7_9ARCH|nr:MAG: 6-carboxytetrahydropterin synthase [Candidatus Heimdallarchaeum endolithica]